eukprot:CAMPEP_0177616794 /NCGR_PEP_ID=MMETSP0419_2-20121207/24416_1 /TAXON_ID=582737 /ORGANISM="Tetraselmis sp., Strain GSL018" /LENGTH=166 /DNA_ID=CAMNT_0019115017 /DNA_START=2562 /DNA_END=3062 /DNA_ORIENTATION=+
MALALGKQFVRLNIVSRPSKVEVSNCSRYRLGATTLTDISARRSLVSQKLEISHDKLQARAVPDTVVYAGKMKTRKAAAKRYKVTGSGKVMVRRPGKQHLNEKYSRNQKKALSRERALSRSVVKRNVIGALPYAKIDKKQNPKPMQRDVKKKAAKAQPAAVPEGSE